MIHRFDECGPQLHPEQILRFERAFGVALPDDYRAFLLAHNGGRPNPNAYRIAGLKNNPVGIIHFFFGINDPVISCNLDWNLQTYKGRIPQNLLPIACDDCGDLICLSLYGNDAGAILFWDRHQETPEPSEQNIFRIAGSLTEFLNNVDVF